MEGHVLGCRYDREYAISWTTTIPWGYKMSLSPWRLIFGLADEGAERLVAYFPNWNASDEGTFTERISRALPRLTLALRERLRS